MNRIDPNSQPTILHLKQVIKPVKNDRNHLPIRILNIGIDVPRYGRNIDNRTGMKPQGPILTTIPESNRANNLDILNLFIKTLDIFSMVSRWHDTIRSETGNLMENLRDNKIFKNAERENNSNVEKFGRKNSVNWNHTD